MNRHFRIVTLCCLAALAGAVGLAIVAAQSSTTYPAWASAAGLTGPAADANADPDADGLANLLEYAFDGNPLVARRPVPGEPVVTIVTESYLVRPGTQDYAQIQYTVAPGRSDLYVRPEISYDLSSQSWVHGAASLRILDGAGGSTIARETRQIRRAGYHTRGFMRVRVAIR